MALSKPALSALIKSKRLAALGTAGVDNAAMTADCDAIADAVITHITAAAVVTVPALGIEAPPGTAGGPCLGTATGTIT